MNRILSVVLTCEDIGLNTVRHLLPNPCPSSSRLLPFCLLGYGSRPARRDRNRPRHLAGLSRQRLRCCNGVGLSRQDRCALGRRSGNRRRKNPARERIVRRHFPSHVSDAFTKKDPALLEQILHDGWVDIPGAPGTPPGPAGVKPLLAQLTTTFPDLKTC
jgi:hypothetical protein